MTKLNSDFSALVFVLTSGIFAKHNFWYFVFWGYLTELFEKFGITYFAFNLRTKWSVLPILPFFLEDVKLLICPLSTMFTTVYTQCHLNLSVHSYPMFKTMHVPTLHPSKGCFFNNSKVKVLESMILVTYWGLVGMQNITEVGTFWIILEII